MILYAFILESKILKGLSLATVRPKYGVSPQLTERDKSKEIIPIKNFQMRIMELFDDMVEPTSYNSNGNSSNTRKTSRGKTEQVINQYYLNYLNYYL